MPDRARLTPQCYETQVRYYRLERDCLRLPDSEQTSLHPFNHPVGTLLNLQTQLCVTGVLNPARRGQEQCNPFQSDTRVCLGIAQRNLRFPHQEARFRAALKGQNIS